MSKSKLTLALALSIITCLTACENETRVSKIDPTKAGKLNSEGVVFSLPETVVVTEVPLTKTDSSPGTFSDWTEFFYPELTKDDYVTEEKTIFKIGAPTFTTRGQTDPNHVYLAHIKAKQFETKTLLLEFNDDGIIAKTDASSKDESIDIITSGIKTVASIAAPLLPIGAGGAAVGENKGTTMKIAVAGKDDETYFREHLSPRALALYEALSQPTKDDLRDNFGYRFLVYVTQISQNNDNDAAGIEFFLTLNEKQWKIVKGLPKDAAPCPPLPRTPGAGAPPAPAAGAPNCVANNLLVKLTRAMQAYNKIHGLRLKRQDYLNESTQPQVNNSANLEFRLKELDNQITSLEQTYFLGTSTETSATAKFEFKPDNSSPALLIHNFFTYAAGGPKPGICVVAAETPGVFKAMWPKKLKGSCRQTPVNFEAGDFRDLKGLSDELKKGGAAGADPVNAYLFTHIPTAAPALDTSTALKRDALTKALVVDLNNLLSGPRLDAVGSFAGVKLSAATVDLINTPGGVLAGAVPKLNRLVLEDAYPEYFYRLASWTAKSVDVNVDDAPPGMSQTVKSAQLKEDGKRGFPYRVAPSTIARLLDDGTEKARSDVRIAQFGPVQTLPAGLGGRRSGYTITYYDASGAIKTFNMSADALIQKQNITDLTDAATTLRDAESARLKRETDLLKAKKDKLDAEKALQDAQKQAQPTPSPQ